MTHLEIMKMFRYGRIRVSISQHMLAYVYIYIYKYILNTKKVENSLVFFLLSKVLS